MSEFVLRQATLADAETIFALVREHPDELVPRSMGDIVNNADRFVLAETDGGETVGCASYSIHPEIGRPRAATVEIQSVAVRSAWRGRGVGRLLVEEILRRIASFGPAEAIVLTFAPGFFAKLGFSEIDKSHVMHKLYTGCINCTKHADPFSCPEKAMVRPLIA